MRVLLDTQAFLWFVLGDQQLSSRALTTILDEASTILVSPASYWEIAIKIGLGKYVMRAPYETFMQRGIEGNGFGILPIEYRHTRVLTDLPYHHRDPFDRLLVTQAMVEEIAILSSDPDLDAYPIVRVW